MPSKVLLLARKRDGRRFGHCAPKLNRWQSKWVKNHHFLLNYRTVLVYTAISREFVGKSAHDNPERYYGRFWVHCSSKNFERIAREAMDMCQWVLKESNKSRFDSYSVRNRNSVLIISHITFRDCRVHFFSDNLSRNTCILKQLFTEVQVAGGGYFPRGSVNIPLATSTSVNNLYLSFDANVSSFSLAKSPPRHLQKTA